MNFCRPELTPRQELQVISHELLDLREHIYELASLDTGLRGSPDFYSALNNLVEAYSSICHLRGRGCDIACIELERCWHASTPIMKG